MLFLAVYAVTFGMAAAFLYRAACIRRRDEQATAAAAADGTRVAENYANHRSVRTAVDTNTPPRKETP